MGESSRNSSRASLPGSATRESSNGPVEIAALAVRIARGEEGAVDLLYRRLLPGLQLYFRARRMDEMTAEDYAQEAFLEAVRRLQAGALDNPACFVGYLWTVAHRFSIAWLRQQRREVDEAEGEGVWRRAAAGQPGPEEGLLQQERRRIALAVLRRMNAREREVLVRFYLWEQDAATICEEMGLTADQFRLLKWRAKARFGELGRKRLQPRLVRTPARVNAA